MGDLISINTKIFTGAVNSLRAAGSSIQVEGLYEVEINENSMVLKKYSNGIKSIQALLSSYQLFLGGEIKRIQSAGIAMVNAEKDLLH